MEDTNTTTDSPTPPEDTAANPTPPEQDAPDAEAQATPLDPIAQLQQELAQWKDLALRARADLDNYRKRMATEKSESIRYANQSLFETLLPVIDNFHFGLEAARNATDPQGVLMGMEMVYKQFNDFLENQNIATIPAEPGSQFDPNVHEAVAQEHAPEIPEGAILKTVRAGYRMGDRLIRASNVVVSKGPHTTSEA